MISPKERQEYLIGEDRSTDLYSTEAGTTYQLTGTSTVTKDFQHSGMLYSTLLMVFLFVNLSLLVLFLLTCIYARRTGPTPKTRPAKNRTTEVSDPEGKNDRAVNRNLEASTPDGGVAGTDKATEEQQHPAQVDDVTSSAEQAEAVDSEASGSTGKEAEETAAASGDARPETATPPEVPASGAESEEERDNAALAMSSSDRELTEDDVSVQVTAADWRTETNRQPAHDDVGADEAPEPEVAEADSAMETVYDNQLAISLAAAIFHAAKTTAAIEEVPDDDSDDVRQRADYVNVAELRQAEVGAPKSARRHDYVNVSDWLEMSSNRSGDNDYVNMANNRPPSYLDLFKADAKRKLNAARRLSRRLIDVFRSSDGQ